MKIILIIAFYIAHLFLMLAGIVFAVLYFTQGGDDLAEGLITKDAESLVSLRWWQVIVGAIYPIFMLLGVHLLFKRKEYAALVYALGCGIYVLTNAASYMYTYLTKSESTASIEDLWFCILFVCLAALVRFFSARQAVSNNT